jgi:hypothetical protein
MVSLIICMACSFVAGRATREDRGYVFGGSLVLAIYFFFVVVGQLV